jgi:outer membrane murein-binding lipoprotein Lpp
MADTWLTIEQAAVALGLSVRTVNRHIVAGKIPSRLQDGRREVLVQAPSDKTNPMSTADRGFDDSPFGAVLSPFASDGPSATGPAITGHATVTIPAPQSHVSDRPSDRMSDASSSSGIDPETVLALADNANEKAELAVAAYQALARATDVQFQHVRRSARLAWSSVAVMAACVSVAVGWTTHQLTKTQAQSEYLQQQVQSKSATADTLSAERDGLRADLSAAKEQAARAEGKASVLTDIQSKLEAEVKEAQARAADAQVREHTAKAERQATTQAATQPATRPADARADGQGG